MSTVLPGTIQALAAAVRARGAGILDAPVSGSVATTQSGELTIMVGGETADLERARPVLELLARRIFHLGGLGTGAAMKLAVNTVIFGLNGAVAEGLVLAERSGIERGARLRGPRRERGRRPVRRLQARRLRRARDDARSRSRCALAEKDLRLIAGLAEASGSALPQAAVEPRTDPGRRAVGRARRRLLDGRESPA